MNKCAIANGLTAVIMILLTSAIGDDGKSTIAGLQAENAAKQATIDKMLDTAMQAAADARKDAAAEYLDARKQAQALALAAEARAEKKAAELEAEKKRLAAQGCTR